MNTETKKQTRDFRAGWSDYFDSVPFADEATASDDYRNGYYAAQEVDYREHYPEAD